MTVDEKNATNANVGIPVYEYITFRMSRVQSKLNAQATRLLQREVGISLSQWRVITLVGNAGRARLSDLAHQSALDKGLMSRNLKVLVSAGLVDTQADKNDMRAQQLSLTPKGQEIFDRARPITQERQRKLTAALTEEELVVFNRALDKLEIAAEQ